jgi:hypothetical protein
MTPTLTAISLDPKHSTSDKQTVEQLHASDDTDIFPSLDTAKGAQHISEKPPGPTENSKALSIVVTGHKALSDSTAATAPQSSSFAPRVVPRDDTSQSASAIATQLKSPNTTSVVGMLSPHPFAEETRGSSFDLARNIIPQTIEDRNVHKSPMESDENLFDFRQEQLNLNQIDYDGAEPMPSGFRSARPPSSLSIAEDHQVASLKLFNPLPETKESASPDTGGPDKELPPTPPPTKFGQRLSFETDNEALAWGFAQMMGQFTVDPTYVKTSSMESLKNKVMYRVGGGASAGGGGSMGFTPSLLGGNAKGILHLMLRQ